MKKNISSIKVLAFYKLETKMINILKLYQYNENKNTKKVEV